MDPVLAQAILRMMQGDSDLSGLTGAVEKPLLMYLSGAYNPMSGVGGTNSALWTQYAGNPEYPATNEIINLITQGADEFQVKAAANRLTEKQQTDVFDSDTFVQLASALAKDYRKNQPGGENDYWSKEGLYRPEDVYTEANLPMGPQLLAYLQDYQSKESGLMEEAERLRQQADKASKEYKAAKPRKESVAQARSGRQRNISTATTPQVNIGQAKTGRQRNISTATTPKVNLGEVKSGRQRNISTAGRGSGLTPDQISRLEDQSFEAGLAAKKAEDALKMEQYLKDQYIKGYLGGIAKSGRTPLNDQLRQMTNFMSQAR